MTLNDDEKSLIVRTLCDRRRKLRKLIEKFGEATDPIVHSRIAFLSSLIKKVDKA